MAPSAAPPSKRQRAEEPAPNEITGQDDFEVCLTKLRTTFGTHSISLEDLKTRLDEFEEVYYLQQSEMRRENVTLKLQNKELEQHLIRAKQQAGTAATRLSQANNRRTSASHDLTEAQEKLKALNQSLNEAQKERAAAVDALEPTARRLGEMRYVAQRMHDLVIRHLPRQIELYAELQGDEGRAKPRFSKERRAAREREIADTAYYSAMGWACMLQEYPKLSRDGDFMHKEDGEVDLDEMQKGK